MVFNDFVVLGNRFGNLPRFVQFQRDFQRFLNFRTATRRAERQTGTDYHGMRPSFYIHRFTVGPTTVRLP